MLKKLALAYTAGTIGGIANTLFGAVLGLAGIFTVLGIQLPAPEMPATLYQRMVWGGIWGAVLFLPLTRNFWSRSFLMGLLPSLVAGFIVFPAKTGKGMFGVEISPLMPVIIFAFNWVWGMATLAFFKLSLRGESAPDVDSST